MKRTALAYLEQWLLSTDRKPLIIRGARQVGKTWIARDLAKKSGKTLVELNFEKNPADASLFESNHPAEILLNIGARYHQSIDPTHCLLFLDEIQAVPQLFAKLRWFSEEMPQLPVIAAGSLLEFVLAEHQFSMPVGRISYMHLEPLSFEEFLLANEKSTLLDYLISYDMNKAIPLAIHDELSALFKTYLLIGGMPASVVNWTLERSLNSVNRIQNDLLATYRDDFSKYRGRIAVERLDEVLMAVPKWLGQKFVYSRVNASIQASTIKHVLDLLGKARVCHRVQCCSANGVPLAAELNEKYFKEIFIDVGLCGAALGFNLNLIQSASDITMINNGGIAEQVVGQLLRTITPPYIEPGLYYWLREEKNSNAEIDYVIQHHHQVVPIEVKAGSSGGLKSLHLYMDIKKSDLAVRVNSDSPSVVDVKIKNHAGYRLISIPFYLVGQVRRLIDQVM